MEIRSARSCNKGRTATPFGLRRHAQKRLVQRNPRSASVNLDCDKLIASRVVRLVSGMILYQVALRLTHRQEESTSF